MDRFVLKTAKRLRQEDDTSNTMPCLAEISSAASALETEPTATASGPALVIAETSEKPNLSQSVRKPSVLLVHSFKSEWSKTFPWLFYDGQLRKAFCATCKEANDKRLVDNAKFVKGAFITDGFSDWKHTLERFRGHEKSDCHRCAVTKIASVAAGQNVLSGLSKAKEAEMAAARSSLHRTVTSLMYVGEQGLAVRGKTDGKSNFLK
jgi:hypothetical protein